MDNAKKDQECYRSFVPIPRQSLTVKWFIKWTAKTISGGNTCKGIMFCPEDVEPFELWPGNRFKKYKEVAEYTGKDLKRKRPIDPNSKEVFTYTENGLPLGTHFETASDYASFLDSDVKNYKISHKAFAQ